MKTLATFLLFTNIYCQAQSDILVDNRDGKVYRTVQIGKQVWMAENLPFIDSFTEAVCYGNDYNFCNRYGALYTWKSAMSACPSGWHLPSKPEFDELFKFFWGNKRTLYRTLISGGSSGFEALAAGYVNDYGFRGYHFYGIEQGGFYWSSSTKPSIAEARCVSFSRLKRVMVTRLKKRWLASVRCIRD